MDLHLVFPEAVKETDSGIILEVFVHPQSKQSGFYGYNQWRKRLEFYVKAPPAKGKANDELCSVISEVIGLAKSNVVILSGLKSTNKTVLLKGIDLKSVLDRLEGHNK